MRKYRKLRRFLNFYSEKFTQNVILRKYTKFKAYIFKNSLSNLDLGNFSIKIKIKQGKLLKLKKNVDYTELFLK